jgi:hypothetical protein
VLCVRSGDDGAVEALPDADCDAASRPAEEEFCVGLPPCDASAAATMQPQAKKSVIKVAAPSRAVRQRPLRRHRKRAEARAARTQLAEQQHQFQWHLGNWSHVSRLIKNFAIT